MNAMTDTEAMVAMRSYVQKVATGPEYSKDLSYDEARNAMRLILGDKCDPIQTGILFIALRMKRETDDENKGFLQAIIDDADIATAAVDELVDVADPYDGYNRGLPASPFIAPVLAACGMPAVSHGLDAVGPKFGITHHKVLKAAGINVGISSGEAAARIANSDIGWAYVDQAAFAPRLHDLIKLRQRMVKRQVLTTVEVLVGPVRAQQKTHLYTGFVHKAYPPIYSELARFANFDSLILARGVEGGVVPSLQQPARIWHYENKGEESFIEVNAKDIGIESSTRAVPIPADAPASTAPGDEIATPIDSDAMAALSAELGIAALKGAKGGTYDSLVYSGAIVLSQLKRYDSLQSAADAVRKALDSGAALARFEAATSAG